MKTKINNYQKEQKELAITLEFLLGSYTKSVLDKAKYLIQKLNKQTKQLTNNKLITNTVLTTIFILSLALITSLIFKPNYNLSQADLRLTGQPDINLTKQLSYDHKTQSWTIIPNTAANVIAIGSGNSLYGFTMPTNLSRGIKLYDAKTHTSFTITPEFKTNTGKFSNGRFIYPINNQSKVIYTVKLNGLQEDIVFAKPLNDAIFSYKLALPSSLKARMMPSGAIGIYSASQFANENVAASGTVAQTELAKLRAKKDNLVFALMPPTIKQTNAVINKSRTKFELQGNQLTLVASNLNTLKYPISIDPTVVDVNASAFALGNRSNIAISSSCNNGVPICINVDPLVGGDICVTSCSYGKSGWETPNNDASDFPSGFTNVAYSGSLVSDGTMYVVGGCKEVTSACDTLTNLIQYASFNSSGGVPTAGFSSSSWSTDTSLPIAVYQAGVTTYNGYLYIVGGCTSLDCTQVSDNIYYRQLNPNGGGFAANTSWATVTLPSTYTNGTVNGGYGISAATFNDFIYILGGCNANTGTGTSAQCDATNNVWHGELNANGSFSLTEDSSYPFTTARFDAGAYAFNNYLYLAGGCSVSPGNTYTLQGGSCTPDSDIQYVALTPLNSATGAPGTLGDAWTTSRNSFNTGRYAFAFTIADGFAYVAGGCSQINTSAISECSSPLDDVQYASLGADGEVNPVFTDNSTLLNVSNSASMKQVGVSLISYNNFLYSAGGWDGTNLNGVTFAPIDTAQLASTWQETGGSKYGDTDTPDQDTLQGGAAIFPGTQYGFKNNYIYMVDGIGYSNNTVSGPGGSVYVTNINNLNQTGQKPTWTKVGQLTTAVMGFGIALSGDYLYIIDGCTSWNASNAAVDPWQCGSVTTTGTTDVVQYFEINPNNGALCQPGNASSCTGTGCPNTLNANANMSQYGNCTFTSGNVNPAGGPSWDPVYIECGGSCNNSGVLGNATTAVTYQNKNYIVSALGWDGKAAYATNQTGILPLNNDGSLIGGWSSYTSTGLLNGCHYDGNLVYDPDNQEFYYIGGYSPTSGSQCGSQLGGYAVNYVWYDSAADVIGGTPNWQQSTITYPTGIAIAVAGYYNGSIYVANGDSYDGNNGTNCSGCGYGYSGLTSSYYSQIQSNGDIGSWKTFAGGTVGGPPRSGPSGVIFNSYMYIGGGSQPRYDSCSPSCDNNTLFDMWFARLGTAATGSTSNWINNGTNDNLPVTLADDQSVAANGYLYVFGGVTNNGSGSSSPSAVSSNVYYALITPGGGLAPPSTCTPVSGIWCSTNMPIADYDFGLTAQNGYVYIAGGCGAYATGFAPDVDNCSNPITGNNIYYSKLNVNGGLTLPPACTQVGTTQWCTLNGSSPISGGEFGLSEASYNGYIYVLAGCSVTSSACGSYPTNVYYSEITSNGSLSSLSCQTGDTQVNTNWCSSANTFTTGRMATSVTIYDGYIYLSGGFSSLNTGNCTATWESDYCSDIQYAPIKANGSIGTWTTQSWRVTSFASTEAYNGYLYSFGGYAGGTDYSGGYNTILNSDGSTGLLQNSSVYVDDAEGSAVYNGFLYGVGGFDPTQTSNSSSNYGWSNQVKWAGVESSPRIGYYSQLIDIGKSGLGGDATPTYIINTGNDLISSSSSVNPNLNFNADNSGLNGGMSLQYLTSTGSGSCSGTLNVSYMQSILAANNNLLSAPPQGQQQKFDVVTDGCGNSTDSARYIWLLYTIDDSQTYTFNNDNSTISPNVTQLSRIDLFYHPSPNTHLRGGMSLVNGNKQSLDTTP